jgi:hypothetical protein
METVIRNVRDLDHSDRSALERVIGHQLWETQRVIVNVVNLDLTTDSESGNGISPPTPPWGSIYDGLSNEEIDRLDSAIRQRANLTRATE